MENKMHLIYVAGSYRADHPYQVKLNIQAAERTGMEVAKLENAFPVIPHCCCAHWDGLRDGQYFIDGTMEMMLRCDAVLLVLGSNLRTSADYKSSPGTVGEVEAARKTGIPVFTKLADLRVWLIKEACKSDKESFMQRIRKHFYE